MTTMYSYEDHPESLTELRGEPTPRDILIACLRRLDRGEGPAPKSLIVLGIQEDGLVWTSATELSRLEAIGALEYAKADVMEEEL